MTDQPNNRAVPSNTILLWLSETALLFGCYTLAGYFLNRDTFELYLLYDNGLIQNLVVTLFIQIGLWLQRLYSHPQTQSRTLFLTTLVRVLGVTFLSQALWFYLNPMILVPRTVMLFGSLAVLLVLPLWRMAFTALQDRVSDNWRLLLIGDSPTLRKLAVLATGQSAPHFIIASVLDTSTDQTRAAALSRFEGLVTTCQPTHVVIAGNPPYSREFLNLQWSGLKVLEATEFYENTFRRVSVGELGPGDLLFSKTFHPEDSGRLSSVLALVLGLLTLPLTLLVALAIRITNGDAVVTRSLRQGRGGKPFQLYRFRVPPSPSRLGRWLLKSGLYRLPELLNVLRGELALIGPRPLHPGVVKALEKRIPPYRLRSGVRPGIVGWAQLNMAHGPVNPLVEIEYDLYYIKHQDAPLDFYILGHSYALGEKSA